MERQYRLDGASLDDDEDPDQHGTGQTEADDRRRGPTVGRTAEAGEEHQECRREHEYGRPEIVNNVVDAAQVAWDLGRHDRERHGHRSGC